MYRIFDISLTSEIQLPGLSHCYSDTPDWVVTTPSEPLDDSAFQWIHSWKSEDGRELMKTARRGEEYLLNVFDMAVFHIQFSKRQIDAYALQECPSNSMAHLLLDQVLPRVLCHQGQPVIHASSVLLNDGSAIAFSGPSGRGKSTLATAFHKAGHPVLADDCLLLKQRGSEIIAISAYSSLRLWPDSLDLLLEGADVKEDSISEMAHYTSKKQFLLESLDASTTLEPPALSALFILDDPADRPQCDEIRISPASGSSAIMAIIESSFSLDVVGRDAIRRNFEAVGKVASHVPVFNLSYPRQYEKLTQTIAKITEFSRLQQHAPET